MVFYIKYNMSTLCKKIVQEQLDKLNVTYSHIGVGEVEIHDDFPPDMRQQLNGNLNYYGCEIIDSTKNTLIQKIKDAIIELIYIEEKLPESKISTYLADKLKYKYGYLSNLFSEVTCSTIANFILLQKTERAKQLIITTDLNISEIAWKLNYSSQAHFCTQFKNVTGLTPLGFKRIIKKRRQPKEIVQ